MQYKIYTTEFDEVVRPLDVRNEEDLAKAAERFHLLCPVESLEPLKERLEKLVAPPVPTAVTILIDNSGSMRGAAASFSTGATGIISSYLDRLEVPNEILGFTTVWWKGGEPREQWHAAGRPDNPGRLNATRHIVYKQFDEKLEDVRNNLALMTIEGIMKENIDGEAVQWACERLRSYEGVDRRILLVISDGAPTDDSTLFAYPIYVNESPSPADREKIRLDREKSTNILQDHLTSVVEDINYRGDIIIDAIGIRHDVSQYYKVGDRIDEIADLGPVAIRKLEQLLGMPVPNEVYDLDEGQIVLRTGITVDEATEEFATSIKNIVKLDQERVVKNNKLFYAILAFIMVLFLVGYVNIIRQHDHRANHSAQDRETYRQQMGFDNQ